MAKRKPTQIVQVGTRLPERMRVALEKSAKARGESLNAEIVRRLEMSLSADKQLILAYGGNWLSVIRSGGDLLVALPISWDDELGIDDDLVTLKVSEDDLNRIRNFFRGAPPPYNLSNAEISAGAAGPVPPIGRSGLKEGQLRRQAATPEPKVAKK